MNIGTGINNSATITAKAKADISSAPAFLAATLSSDGLAVAKASEAPIGIFIPETGAAKAGDDLTVQVKDIGLAKVGAAVAAGALLSADANGALITATEGEFALAVALEAATAADQVISVQIVKAGYVPAAD